MKSKLHHAFLIRNFIHTIELNIFFQAECFIKLIDIESGRGLAYFKTSLGYSGVVNPLCRYFRVYAP